MNEAATGETLRGKRVVTADGIELGGVDGEAETHIRVLAEATDLPGEHLWLPRAYVEDVTGRTIRLSRRRAELHDAVLQLSPGEQREYATLNAQVRIGRQRWLGGEIGGTARESR